MSSRAAARLEAMGFTPVYDYVGGKNDWLAGDLPIVGTKSGRPRAGDLAQRDPPKCRPTDVVGEMANRTDVEEWGFCVVTDGNGVVHGLLRHADAASTTIDGPVQDAMLLGPQTIRPNRSLESSLGQMDEVESEWVLVTTDLGELIGVLYREDANRHLAE